MKTKALALFLLMLVGCRETRPAGPTADTVQMQIGSETFTLEIADSPAEQQQGLMARGSMPADHGMIFVFPDARELTFWMKDTLIPLDILYLDEGGGVVSIKPLQPRDLTSVPSDGLAMYAIELNQGSAARVGVRPGDVLTIPSVILDRQGRK